MRLMDWKSDKQDIDNLEKKVKAFVDEALSGIGKYADKDEVMKKLLAIDKQVALI